MPLRRGTSEVELQSKLNLARIAGPSGIGSQDRRERVGHLAKRRVPNVGDGSREVRMIECIEELGSELQQPAFVEAEILEQTQIECLNSGAIELARSTGPEGPGCRLRKSRRIDQKAGGGVPVVVGRGTCEGIADTVGIDRADKAEQAVIAGGNRKGTTGLQGHNSVELPVSQHVTGCAAGKIRLALPEWQFPDEVPDKAVADVEIRITHLGGVVVGVLGKGAGGQIVAEIGEAMAPGVP